MYLYASVVTKTKKQTNVISLNRSIHTLCLTLFSAIKTRFIEAFQMRFLIKKKKCRSPYHHRNIKRKCKCNWVLKKHHFLNIFLNFCNFDFFGCTEYTNSLS